MLNAPFRVRIATTLVLLLGIVVVSVTPATTRAGDDIFVWIVIVTPALLQKSLHVLAYGALAAAMFWTAGPRQPTTSRSLAALAAAVVIGALLEWWQTVVPGRFGTLSDVLLNTIGSSIGIVAANAGSRTVSRDS